MSSARLPRSLFLTGAAAAVLGLAACGSQDDEAQGGSESTDSSSPSSTPEPVELPGGGREVFPDRRMVALYGTPGVPGLGCLGEQDLQASITRVQELAKEYEPFSEEPVIPAFEIITTVASAEAGPDGDYSNELDPKSLKPWIDAAGEAGIYCVLDLQPGSTDFLTQAKRYEVYCGSRMWAWRWIPSGGCSPVLGTWCRSARWAPPRSTRSPSGWRASCGRTTCRRRC